VELRQLRYFIAVAEELNFTRAAERCHIAQPPLSQQVKKLEEELEVRLFDRANKKVALTDEGKAFLPVAQKTLKTLECGVEQVRMVSRGEVGRLRIGFVNSAIQTSFPDGITAFRKQYPGIILDIREMSSADQAKALTEDNLDVAICQYCYATTEGLESRALHYDTYALAVHRDHPLAERGAGGWKDLDKESFIIFSRQHYPDSYDRTIARFQRFGVSPHIVQEATTHQTKIALVAAGMGLAFVPERMRAVCPPQVRLIPFEWEGVQYQSAIMLAWKKGTASKALQCFLDVMDGYVHHGEAPLEPEPYTDCCHWRPTPESNGDSTPDTLTIE